MNTLTRIPRAEAIRRFTAATHVTITARTIRGEDVPNNGDGTPLVGVRREVARVTSTGVYYIVGHSVDGTRKIQSKFAGTRFADSPEDTWSEDTEGNLVLTTYYTVAHYAGRPTFETREHGRITYKLEGGL